MTTKFSQLPLALLYNFDYLILKKLLKIDPRFRLRWNNNQFFKELIEIKENDEIKNLTEHYSDGQFWDLPEFVQLETIINKDIWMNCVSNTLPTEIHEDVKVLYINIDRGVSDWDYFTEWVSNKFPNLKVLFLRENFSQILDDKTPIELKYDAFLRLIKKLKLFVFKDFQSRDLRGNDFYNLWKNNLPSASTHIFLINCSIDRQSGPIKEYVKDDSKLLVRGRNDGYLDHLN